jgi:putative endonuclease
MLYFVYILFSEKDGRLYVGCTDNPKRRLNDHNYGRVIATKRRRPLVMIYTEGYKQKTDAFQRERFLKSLWAGRLKKKILKEYLDKIGRKNSDG